MDPDEEDRCEIAFVARLCSGDGPAAIAYSPLVLTEIDADIFDILLERDGSLYRPTFEETYEQAVAVIPTDEEDCSPSMVRLVRCGESLDSFAPAVVDMLESLVSPFGDEGDVLVATYVEWSSGEPVSEVVCYTHEGATPTDAGVGVHDMIGIEIIGVSDDCDPCEAVEEMAPLMLGGSNPVDLV